MNKLKFDNSNTEEGGLSRRTGSFTKRFLAMTGAAALVVGGAGSVFIGASAASAATAITSANYVVGTSVSGFTYTQSNPTADVSAINMVSFVSTSGMLTTDSLTVSLTGATTSPLAATNVSYTGYDATTNTHFSGTVLPSNATSKVSTLTINPGISVAAGNTVSLSFSDLNVTQGTAQVVTPSIFTTQDSTPVTGTPFSIAATSSPATTDSLSTSVYGASATLSVGNFEVFTAANPAAANVATAFPKTSSATNKGIITLSEAHTTFTSNPADYTVVEKTASGVTNTYTGSTDLSVVGTTGSAVITLVPSIQIGSGSTLSVSANNAVLAASSTVSTTVNPTVSLASTANATLYDALASGTTGSSVVSGTALAFTALDLGTATAVSGVSVTPAVQTEGAATSYNVGLTLATSSPTSVSLVLASGTTLTTGAEATVTDTTAGTVGSANVALGSSPNIAVITLPTTGFTYSAGDSLVITLLGVTNTTNVGSQSASVYTSKDSTPVAAAYSTTAATTVTSTPTVTLSDSSVGASSTYTVSGVSAAAAYPVGATSSQIGLYFKASSIPTAVSQYTIKDLTNPAATSSPATVTLDSTAATTYGTGYLGVTLTVGKAIAAGDQLQIIITGVINPTTGASEIGDFTGLVDSTVIAPPTFPTTAMTYPNGAFVQSGAQIDVIAGGFGFGISTQAAFGQLQAMNPASVVTGTFPTATGPRAGTLIQVAGSAGIWVVGTDGKIYQFSSASQFMADGYSPMQVVEVPSSGGLTAGTGVPPTAATTMADGSIQNFGGTFYVYDGGHAFGISTQAQAAAVEASTGSTVITGSGSAPASSTIADGSLIQPVGSAGIYVTSGGSANQFNSGTQLRGNGYTGMYVVAVPSLGSVTVA